MYARDLCGKPLSVSADEAEALVRQAQGECRHAQIDLWVAWGVNEALEEYERLQSICRGLKQIQDDFGKMVDAFVDFLLAVLLHEEF